MREENFNSFLSSSRELASSPGSELDRALALQIPSGFEIISGSMLINDHLEALGMTAPFGADADFSGFGPDIDTQIQHVYHSTYISANEVGIEAAGATAIDGDSDDAPVFDFDGHRPFIFLIRDQPTGLVLFAGRVVDPS